tara:strand:+ start:1533 stop:2102 length:570 start_codon:yes stop_codon:yes gene_type:complete
MKSGHYQIGGPKKCNPCFQPNPSIRIQKSGVERFNGATADIESKLHGTTSSPDNYTLQNQCDGIDSQYSCVHGVHGVHGVGNDFSQINQMQTCFLPTENTRLSNPASNLRGSGINRFNPLCLDPQKGVIFGAQYDIPTRMIAKDTFRPCVPTPSINNMLPEQKELPDFRTILNAPASFIGSLYKYDKCG